MKLHPITIYCIACLGLLASCTEQARELPILGRREAVTKTVNGETVTDTVYHRIPAFSFTNQDSLTVTEQTFANKIYVADFFFTTCPSVCPRMQEQLSRVYRVFKDNPKVMYLSHTIDPEFDSVARLKDYARLLDADSTKWHFVTGPKEVVHQMAQKHYMVSAYEDENADGGFMHSALLVLVDEDRHIRGMYNGLEKESVDKLIADLRLLLREKSS